MVLYEMDFTPTRCSADTKYEVLFVLSLGYCVKLYLTAQDLSGANIKKLFKFCLIHFAGRHIEVAEMRT